MASHLQINVFIFRSSWMLLISLVGWKLYQAGCKVITLTFRKHWSFYHPRHMRCMHVPLCPILIPCFTVYHHTITPKLNLYTINLQALLHTIIPTPKLYCVPTYSHQSFTVYQHIHTQALMCTIIPTPSWYHHTHTKLYCVQSHPLQAILCTIIPTPSW